MLVRRTIKSGGLEPKEVFGFRPIEDDTHVVLAAYPPSKASFIKKPYSVVRMVRLDLKFPSTLQPQLATKQDPGYIVMPSEVFSINLVDEFRQKNQNLPAEMRQWIKEYDYHMFTLPFNLATLRGSGARGAKQFDLDADFTQDVYVTDVAPKTEWVPTDTSLSVNVDFTVDSIGGLIKMVKLPVNPTVNVKFTYAWRPYVAKVVSGGADKIVNLHLESANNQYLDGQHEMIVIFQRPRSIKDIELNISRASVRYDLIFKEDVAYTTSTTIKILIKESSP